MSHLLLGYDTQKSSNKFVIFLGSVAMAILGFLASYVNMHHHLTSTYLLKHMSDFGFYKNTLQDAYNYLAYATFQKDFSFSFVWWWFVYTAVLNFAFLFFYLSFQTLISKNWMKRLYPGDSFVIALKAAFGFFMLAVIVYFSVFVIVDWVFTFNKVTALRYYFMSFPLLWGLATVVTVGIHEDSAYVASIQYKIYPQLKEMIYISNMEQVPSGYSYEYVGFVEATATNNKELADAYLLLEAYRIGANGILKYQSQNIAYTHGTVTHYNNGIASGFLRTDHRYYVTGTAVKIVPNEQTG